LEGAIRVNAKIFYVNFIFILSEFESEFREVVLFVLQGFS